MAYILRLTIYKINIHLLDLPQFLSNQEGKSFPACSNGTPGEDLLKTVVNIGPWHIFYGFLNTEKQSSVAISSVS